MTPGNPVYHSSRNCIVETASKTLVAACKNGVFPSDGNVTSLGNNVFHGRKDLTHIVFPKSVTSIGDEAFFWCTNLTSVVLSKRLNSIGEYAFACCNLESIVLPKNVTSIGEDAFYNCKNLKSIFIPKSVTSIEARAFSDCKNLTIYCAAKQEPDGWDEEWNFEGRPVVWGAKKIQ